MGTFFQDVRYGGRLLAKNPGFTAVAALSLALGIGANTTIFTIINAVLLNPLPVAAPSELMSIFTTDSRNTGGFLSFLQTSKPNSDDYRDKNQVFVGMAGDQGIPISLSGGHGEPEQTFGELATGNYFSLLGVKPIVGRTFLPEEDTTPGGHPVVVLSYGLWQRRFGGDASIVGRTITVNNQAFTVIGVTPESFRGTNTLFAPALWAPFSAWPQLTTGFFRENINQRRALLFNLTGRLKPGVTREQAEANLKTIARQLEQEYPNENKGRSVAVVPIAQATINPGVRGNIVVAGGVLMTIVALVLLIACANVANLLLARAAARQREIAVRLSLGAGRMRLIRQLLTESTILALVGGLAGMLLAYWAQDVLWAFRPQFVQADALDLRPDTRVLLFTMGIAVFTGLLFGLAPALQASRANLVNELKDRTSPAMSGSSILGLRSLLVIAQVALSLVALIGAGLFLRSLQNAQHINPGFETEKLAVMTFDLGSQGYDQTRGRQFHRNVLERIRSIPGVKSTTFATIIPLFGGGLARSVFPEGQDPTDRQSGVLVQVNAIDAGYFETLGIPLLRGREFVETDKPASPAVVIVNETMAKKFWPNQDAVGKRFKFFGAQDFTEIVGIARDSKYNFIGEDPQPFIYAPIEQAYQPAVSLHVRTEGDPSTVLGTVRGEVQRLDRNLPITNVFTIGDVFKQSLWAPRMGASLLAVFAGLSLVLAIVGIYGVTSYSVSQRTRELGIRMALGADRGTVQGMVLAQGMTLAAIGLALGLAAAFAVTRFLSSLLYDISPTDLVTFVAIPLGLAVAALIANYVPARRATRIDPVTALRYD